MTQSFAATSAVVYFDQDVNKFSCKLDGKHLGSSKHFDYFEYHYRRNDIASLCALTIEEFVYLNDDETIKEVKPTKRKPMLPQMQSADPIKVDRSNQANSFLNILFPSTNQMVACADVFDQKRQRGRPRKQQDEVPAGVHRNTLSDDEPTDTPIDVTTRRAIKIDYNRMVEFNDYSIAEAITELMIKYKASRSQIYNATIR